MLTRRMLKAMGIDDEKIDQIIEAHSETVDALKDERDSFKESAGKLAEVEQKLADAEKKLGDDSYKSKYDALKSEYDSYKQSITDKETKASKTDAYKALLAEAGISSKRIDVVLRASVGDIDALELDKDGKVKDADKIKENIKTAWSDFVESTGTVGAGTATPPSGVGGKAKMTKEQIVAIKDPIERRSAISQNMELFTGGN